ncbi:amidohydrolase family protein [Ramlibacter sp. G-1-2-2]|uniref:Amidohydrolase family protein n=1 Tax=Ramlibacter agri TaxID=2728837 RepID=A0A848H2V7_9BURK|nr:amidohydrolase family protein [Ramlibacter agri]NML43901.1 amidohydrolase family protein [Ramlibacter agri]
MSKRTFLRCGLAAALMAALGSCATAPLPVSEGTVIRDVAVVDTRTGALQPHRNVVLQGGRILAVTDGPVALSGTAAEVDGSGKYLVPGFNDMHTHALPRVQQQPGVWALLVANGITGIREMAGAPELIAAAHKMNAERAAGRLDAPEILQIPGPLFLGAPSAAAAKQAVRAHKAMGADFIKVVDGSNEAVRAVLEEARAQGLHVSGHLEPMFDTTEAARAGWRSIEHLGSGMGERLDCSADAAGVRSALARGEGAHPAFTPAYILNPMLFRAEDAPLYRRILATQDAAKCSALAAEFARDETWQVPTLIRVHGMVFSDAAVHRQDPHLASMDAATRAQWEDVGRRYAQMPPAAAATFREYYAKQAALLPLFREAGVKMMTGSDLGGAWVVPGFALHDEFRLLAAAGLTPLQVLQMTTWNPAEYLGRQATMGSVEPGRQADLVLLDANPLADVANLDRIAAVVLRGKVLQRPELQRMLEDAAHEAR